MGTGVEVGASSSAGAAGTLAACTIALVHTNVDQVLDHMEGFVLCPCLWAAIGDTMGRVDLSRPIP